MTRGIRTSPDADIDSIAETQPVEPLVTDIEGPVRRSKTTNSL